LVGVIGDLASTSVGSIRLTSINNLHKLLGHYDEATARITGNAMDMILWVSSRHVKPVQLEHQDTRIINKDGKSGIINAGERLM
jgi:hypothetical protein